jgi:hypothetical protein
MQVMYEPWTMKNEDLEVWGIKILEGEFDGTAITINDLEMAEDEKGGLNLDYTVVKWPDGREGEKDLGPAFEEVLTYVMTDILQKAVNEYENRNGDSTESNK